jgi:hypothetical protein
MATADRDEDEKDEAAEDEKDEGAAPAKEAKAGTPKKEKAPSESERAAKAAQHATGHEDEDDEEDEDEEEEIKPAPKPVAKAAAKRSGIKGPGAARGKAGAPPPGGGSLGKSVMLFFVIVIGLGAGFAILGKETPVEVAKPKWKVGETADVEITLVRSDRQDLACASTEEIGGKHCAFEAMSKPWSKGNSTDDKQILKPYTTSDRIQFTAAGLWADPAMAPDKLPATRFTVKCKYKIEGKLPTVGVRWEATGQWYPNTDWYAGSVSDCKLAS